MDSDSPNGTQNENRGGKDAAKNKSKSNRKKAEIVAVFAVIEIISLVLWQKAEDFSGDTAKFIHWISECGFLAGAAYVAHKFTKRHFLIWICYAGMCALMLLTKSIEPKPHLTLSLRIGDSSSILLTNDFFFRRSVVNLISSSNGFELFNGRAMGTIVIPTQTEESNKIFNINAENDSSLKASDFEVAVGVPIDWKIGLDPSAWSRAGQHWIIPGYRLDVTNLQFWLLNKNPSLLPLDSINFSPITNFSIPQFNNPTNKMGFLEIWVRSTEFDDLVAANVIFVRTPTNVFKPFVSGMEQGTNGVWHISLSFKEFEDLQK